MNPSSRAPLAAHPAHPASPNSAIPPVDPHRRLDTDAALLEQLTGLLDSASHRQVWLLFLDDEQRLTDPIMPMDDHPLEPDEPCETEDLGLVPFSEVFVERAQLVCHMIAAREFVVVWERPGADTLSPVDRRWVRAVSDAVKRFPADAACAPTPLRGQLLLHDGGLRLIEAHEAH